MKHLFLIHAIAFLIFSVGCTPTVPTEPTPTPTPATRISLSWETDSKRAPWSDELVSMVRKNFEVFQTASDVQQFCPKFKTLSDDQKLKALGEIIVGVIYFESAYNPTSWMTETTMGIDPITGKQVKSQGLLQLSYQDIQWAKFCEFEWSKDKLLSPSDPKATINDPYKNLRCGIQIMANQVRSRKSLTLTSGVYWAVLRINGKYSKIPQIILRVKKYAPACI